MSERDARIDPRRGDVLGKGESRVTITFANSNGLGFDFKGRMADSPPMPTWDKPWLPGFRKWAKNAEVIERAE